MKIKKDKNKEQHDLFKQTAKDHDCDQKTDLKKIIKKIIKPEKSKQ